MLPLSEVALDSALRRQRQRGRIVSPRRGFYVIVPQEYALAGSPPPSWFIDELMAYLGQPYYVGLLSAAALHGGVTSAADGVPGAHRPAHATSNGRHSAHRVPHERRAR